MGIVAVLISVIVWPSTGECCKSVGVVGLIIAGPSIISCIICIVIGVVVATPAGIYTTVRIAGRAVGVAPTVASTVVCISISAAT